MKTKTSTLQPPAAGLSSLLLGAALLLAMSVPLALRAADSVYVNNSSFEQGGFPGGAGYESIPGWGGGSGVNTSAGPFWDNGNLPDTTLVGFMQGNNLMGQSQGGLVVGQTYWIQAFVNARNGSDTPDLTVYHSASTVGGAALLSGQNIAPVGAGNPFRFVNVPFTAATASGDLNFRAVPHSGGDATMLIDGVCVIARSTNDVVIANPSFEASGTGQSGVGVVNAVAGWNHTGANPSIINQAGGPYLDNGAVPEGNNVLVLQDDSAYSQTLHGLTPGQNYRLTLYLNSRGGTPATALVTIDGNTAYNAPVSQVGGSNPYHFISYDFTASATDVTLAFANQFISASTLFVDNLRVIRLAQTPPTVQAQPVNAIGYPGGSVMLSAVIDGFPTPHLQWQHDASAIPNATNLSVTLNNLQFAAAGNYVLYATNSAGSTHTVAAVLTMLPPPPDSITVVNPSFEDSSYTNTAWPHYGAAAGWASSAAAVGVNDVSGPFWDNGNLPDTAQVAFMQVDGVMGQRQSGFEPGKLYWIQAFVNARVDSDTPDLTVYHSASTFAGAPLLINQNIAPVGSGNPFLFVNVPFIADATSGDLNFGKQAHNGGGGTATLLLDGVSIIRRTTNDIVIANPSFEASGTNQNSPGVVGVVAGWSLSGVGGPPIINQAGGPYLDNGEVVPDGNNVLVIQGVCSYSQTLHGLTPGQNYRLTLYVNGRSGAQPTALITIDGHTAYSAPVPQFGSSPYQLISYDFIASATDVTLAIGQTTATAYFVDNVRVMRAAAVPQISISRQGGMTQITWTGGQLESRTSLTTGSWQSESGATSPFTVNMLANPQKFYRAVLP